MKRLDKVVNVVPVIAKADTLTIEEREHFKSRVSNKDIVLYLGVSKHWKDKCRDPNILFPEPIDPQSAQNFLGLYNLNI